MYKYIRIFSNIFISICYDNALMHMYVYVYLFVYVNIQAHWWYANIHKIILCLQIYVKKCEYVLVYAIISVMPSKVCMYTSNIKLNVSVGVFDRYMLTIHNNIE